MDAPHTVLDFSLPDLWFSLFFFNDTATTEIYTLSLHDALPIGPLGVHVPPEAGFEIVTDGEGKNRGLAAFASTLYDVDLATGTATSLGAIGGPSGAIVGLSTIAEKP